MKIVLQAAASMFFLSLIVGCTLKNTAQTPVFPPTLSPAPIQRPTPTPTRLPTPEKSLTSIPSQVPTFSPGGSPTRIFFPEGTTYNESTGKLPKGEAVRFIVSAEKEQLLMVDVGSRSLDVTLEVKGAFNGMVLAAQSSHLTSWQGFLPTKQDYEITLTATGEDGNFNLGITLPVVIRFSPGAISAAVQGNIGVQQNVHFMLYALAGQTMTVKIRSINNDVLLTLYGINDGQPLVRSVSGTTEWSGILSKSQYYMIVAVSSGNPAQYLLDITIQ